MPSFFVCDFSKRTLSNAVQECFGVGFRNAFAKRQIDYIFNYLNGRADSILIELDYVDRDFLDDFSKYYISCFKGYGTRCARVHFFKDANLNHNDISNILRQENDWEEKSKKIQENYLGFMVIKPLSQTFIGRTCLSIKDTESKKIISRNYEVDLFGIPLNVRSIAFQEQDKVLAACATTAIWTALHGVRFLPWRGIPSLGNITMNAVGANCHSSNAFPNRGLSTEQILRAVDSASLRHHRIEISKDQKDSDWLSCFRIIKSYISSHLPIILIGSVYGQNIKDDKCSYEYKGDHAITVLGYHEKNAEIYAHDDRIGMFVPFQYEPNIRIEFENKTQNDWCLSITLNDNEKEYIVPKNFIIPIDKKARVPSQVVIQICAKIIKNINKDYEKSTQPLVFSFDTILIDTSIYKNKIWQEKFNIVGKEQFLSKNMPRLQWMVRFYLNETVICYVLFDATDTPNHLPVTHVIKPNQELFEGLFQQLLLMRLEDVSSSVEEDKDYIAIMKAIAECDLESTSYMCHLDDQYGECRMPNRIKEYEVAGGEVASLKEIKQLYAASEKTLDELYGTLSFNDDTCVIWAVSQDGALLHAPEMKNQGHPCLTGFKPARIAGELRKIDNYWQINASSGRYSRQHDITQIDRYVQNAVLLFKQRFPEDASAIKLELKAETENRILRRQQ